MTVGSNHRTGAEMMRIGRRAAWIRGTGDGTSILITNEDALSKGKI